MERVTELYRSAKWRGTAEREPYALKRVEAAHLPVTDCQPACIARQDELPVRPNWQTSLRKTQMQLSSLTRSEARQNGLLGFSVLENELPKPSQPQKPAVTATGPPVPSLPPSTHTQTPPFVERTPEYLIRQACDFSAEAYLLLLASLSSSPLASHPSKEAVAGTVVEKVKILVDRIRRIRTFKDQGKAAFKVGKYNVAIEKYTDAIKVDPGNKAVRTPSYLNRELALYKNDDGPQVIEDYTSSLDDLARALDDLIKAASLAPAESAEKRQIEKERAEVRRENLKRDAEERREEEERQWKEKQAMRKDHYGILGIERNPTVTEFRAGYKKLSLETHPDRGGDEERFKEIKASYEFLTDERRRERYDQGDSDAEGPAYEDLFGADGIPFFFFFLSDLLNSYTRGGGRGRGGARGHKS